MKTETRQSGTTEVKCGIRVREQTVTWYAMIQQVNNEWVRAIHRSDNDNMQNERVRA